MISHIKRSIPDLRSYKHHQLLENAGKRHYLINPHYMSVHPPSMLCVVHIAEYLIRPHASQYKLPVLILLLKL